MIKIEFAAETAGELNVLIKQYVGQLTTATRPPENGRDAIYDAADIAVNVDTGKDKKRAPRAPKVVSEPVGEVFLDDTPAETVQEAPAQSAAELLDLKTKTMETLQAAFNAGKINKLRALLNEHGGGAKSFPEVDIAQYPAIAEALRNGALSE